MFKLLMTLFISITFLSAASTKFAKEMGYETNYEKALKKAKLEDKMLMLVMGSKTCPWCKKFEKQTLKKAEVHERVLEGFVPLSLFDDEEYPKELKAEVYPTVYFIDPSEGAVLHSIVGYQNKTAFLQTLEDAE